jgi:proline-rich protein PRCC
MDSLLASYGSDDEDEQEEEKLTAAPPPKVSLFGRLPAPRNSVSLPPPKVETGSKPSLFAALPPPKVENPNDDTSTSKSSLFTALPPPKVEEFDGNPRTLFASLPPPKIEKIDTSLFAALPPPKVEFDSSKVKAEPMLTNPKAKKQSVTFKPPIDVSILEEDDDDWRPSQKKAKAEPLSSTTGGGGLSSLLPAPKHSLGLGSTLGAGATSGGRRAAMEVATTTQDPKPETIARISTTTKNEAQAPQAHVQYDNSAYAVHVKNEAQAPQAHAQYDNSAYAVDVKNEAQVSQDQAHYDNSAYAVDESIAYPPQYANEYHDPSYPSQAPYADPVAQDWHDPSYPSQASSADPLAQVLQAQRRRGREDRMPAPNVIEVKQADLTGGRKLREDQIRTTGIAFGPAYQPSSKDKGSKIHRRKHQIGTLLQDSKAKEMDLLERRARGNLTKAETQAKYGW